MGRGGLSLVKILAKDPNITIIGVSNRNQNIPGIQWAKQSGIYTTQDYKTLLRRPDLDILIDATGNPEVNKHLGSLHRPDFEIIKGMSAAMMWRIMGAREENDREIEKSLTEQKHLCDIGITLAGAETSEQALKLIVQTAVDLLNMSSSSVALFEEKKGEMQVAATVGFKDEEAAKNIWKLRPQSLADYILSQSKPTAIEDLSEEHGFDTSQLEKIGFRSLIAVPLRAEGKIVGILYVYDLQPRKFADREINQMGLLGTVAAFAIEKLLMLEQAEELALTDELTKIYNHRYFIRSLKGELKRAKRYKESVGLCMIDVDNFKMFNDTHGHLSGNKALIQIARILTQNARDTDIVARYGGEEFAIIFLKASKNSAEVFTNRLRWAVEKYPFPGREILPGGKLTVSIGVAFYPYDEPEDNNIAGLIERADQALYRSKADGKNRVTMCNEKLTTGCSITSAG